MANSPWRPMTTVTTSPPEGTTGHDAAPSDHRDPVLRLARLFDPGSMRPLHPADDSGVVSARGRIAGATVLAYCTDATTMGGAMGTGGCRHIVTAIDSAVSERVPVVGLWHSGG